MKLSNFYCETEGTKFNEDPQRGGLPCIFAVQGNEDCIVLMTSANLNNLYIATRGIFAKLGFESEYMFINSQARMNELFGDSQSQYPHLKLRYENDQRSVVILYKGKQKEKETLFAGETILTTDDLAALINELAEANFITQQLKNAATAKIAELNVVAPQLAISPPGGANIVDSASEAKESQSYGAFFQSSSEKSTASIPSSNTENKFQP